MARLFLAVKAVLQDAESQEASELTKNKVAVDLIAKFEKLGGMVNGFKGEHNAENMEVQTWCTAVTKNMQAYEDRVAKVKQRCVESLTKGLHEEHEKLRKVYLGADDGKSWKENLAADALWSTVVKSAGKLLTSEKFASDLSMGYKRMMEVSVEAKTHCPTPHLGFLLRSVCACDWMLPITPCINM
eukprot:5631412-Amphidinium_carterae.4